VIGRPTKYDDSLPEHFIKTMASGFSPAAVAGSLLISRSTLYNWIEEHPEFAEAIEVGKAARQYFLENRLLFEGTSAQGLTAVIFALKNAAPEDWRDKREVAHSGKVAHELALAELE
jgi:hypothetical protein